MVLEFIFSAERNGQQLDKSWLAVDLIMRGEYRVVNSKHTLELAHKELNQRFEKDGFFYHKITTGKRTLPQNSLKSVWYARISSERGDISAKEVERECKYRYGLPILRRDPMHEYVFSKSVDILPYEKRLKVMDCFAVTSVMTVSELKEYLDCMQSDYSYLSSGRKHG